MKAVRCTLTRPDTHACLSQCLHRDEGGTHRKTVQPHYKTHANKHPKAERLSTQKRVGHRNQSPPATPIAWTNDETNISCLSESGHFKQLHCE